MLSLLKVATKTVMFLPQLASLYVCQPDISVMDKLS